VPSKRRLAPSRGDERENRIGWKNISLFFAGQNDTPKSAIHNLHSVRGYGISYILGYVR
jgi:hypothetical protein